MAKKKKTRPSKPAWWEQAGEMVLMGVLQAAGAVLGRRLMYKVWKP